MAKPTSEPEPRDADAFVNEHCGYTDLTRADRHAVRDIVRTSFPIGSSSHELWSQFSDTTVFIRRLIDASPDDPPQGIIGAGIVMSYPADQYDYLAYLVIHPDFRYRRRLFSRGVGMHHGTILVRYVYDVMRSRVSPARLQGSLIIEPAGTPARWFYLRAFPLNVYPLKTVDADNIISVGYDGLVLG